MNSTTRTARRHDWRTALAASALVAMAASSATPSLATTTEELVGVIVREVRGTGDAPERAVARLGGTVERQLPVIDGFEAEVPLGTVDELIRTPGVLAVTPDTTVRLQQLAGTTVTTTEKTVDGQVVLDVTKDVVSTVSSTARVDPALPGAPINVAKAIRADELWAKGVTGRGIDVAVIDSGVVPVPGLAGKFVNGPDLSFEGGDDAVRHLDTYGHGTHMAGIIAGRSSSTDPNAFRGIAPDARIISVKVADATGATDVSQVIAAIDWVVQNRNTEGRNIRVMNLSFGTDGAQDYALDPLAYAAEVAWRNGIVVVASGGNLGSSLGRLMNPAIHPAIIAVGAADTAGTATTADDSVPDWSQRGNRARTVDFVAPGRSIVSLRDPGSWIDANHPSGLIGTELFKGSGTSQAAAVTSGAVALLLSQRPEMDPTQVKYVLEQSARQINASSLAQGRGLIDVLDASKYNAFKRAKVDSSTSTGTGKLDAARGTMRVRSGDKVLQGEVTAMGSTWAGSTWAGSTWAGSLWNGSTWAGSTWAGSTWAGSTWAGSTWAGSTWAGSTWAGSTWAGSTWAGSTWAGSTWASTAFWSGVRWE